MPRAGLSREAVTDLAVRIVDAAPDGFERLSLAASDVVEVIAAVLRGFGLPDDRLIDAVRVVRSGVHGFVVLEAGAGFGLPDDLDRSFGTLLEVLVDGVAASSRR